MLDGEASTVFDIFLFSSVAIKFVLKSFPKIIFSSNKDFTMINSY